MAGSPSNTVAPSLAGQAPQADIGTWDFVAFSIAHAVAGVLLALLSLRGLYHVGRWLGTLEWLINYKRRRRFGAAMSQVLDQTPSPTERRRVTREFFMRIRCDKIFYLIIDRLPREKAVSLLAIDNQDLLDDSVRRGRGVYVAFSHHGPLHVCAMLLSLHGYRVVAIRDRREGGIRRYVQNRFDRYHPQTRRTHFLFADSYPRDIYRCFQDKCVVSSALDLGRIRNPNQKVEELTIFGEKRPFLTGPLRIAMRCGAPVLQAFMFPEPGFRYRLRFVETLVDPDQSGDEASIIKTALQTYAANVERNVRSDPSLLARI
ncbi:MAG: hypothetical protein IID43_06950 [Planctomycetes bacterium]|nr:hypothetical protein [Planctomycetota bacterium]